MTDEEKILSDLKGIAEYFMELYREEEDHHIYGQHYDRMVVVSNACNLIEELLKEQEPRVLTLEEVENSDAPVIVDSYDMPLYYASFEPEFSNETWARFYTLGEEGFTKFLIEDYNKANMWRCWSSRPTDEQREAVKWDD